MVVSGVVSEGTGSGGGTSGTMLVESHRATRAAPPGETVVYPGRVGSTTVESGTHGRVAEPGIPPVIGTLSGQGLDACTGWGQSRVSGVLYVPV